MSWFVQIKERIIKSDKVIWMILILLTMFSLLMVFSTTAKLGDSTHFLRKQIVFFVISYTVIVCCLFINYRMFSAFGNISLWIAIGLLALVKVAGNDINDAKRWLEIPGIGFSFQPSEFAKIAIVLFVARLMSRNQSFKGFDTKTFWSLVWPVIIVIVLVLLDDFSTAVLLGVTVLIMMFVGRMPIKIIGGIAGGALVLVSLMVVISLTDIRFGVGRFDTAFNRIENFFTNDNSNIDDEKNLQINKAKAAIATGKLIGKGPGNSNERYVLPHPYSDFIYAIIIEEFGFLGGFGVLILYLFLMFRAGLIVSKSTRTFPAFLVVGLTSMMVIQALTNMAVAVNIIPVTGQPLPFVSMGGTSQIFTALAFGMILSVTYTINKKEEEIESHSI